MPSYPISDGVQYRESGEGDEVGGLIYNGMRRDSGHAALGHEADEVVEAAYQGRRE